MKQFMDKDFLLTNEVAKELFFDVANTMPIVDYHCHIDPKEIAEDRKFENITQVWLGGDHYKWRQMRSNGVDEYYITGDAPDREKFQKWAETLEKAIGNPLFHWSHLELQRYFGYHGVLNSKTAEEVWNLCNEKLQQDDMSVRNLIKNSNVKLLCTTDDPIDDLHWHKVIKADETFDVKVLPAWRPDKAMRINKPEFADYMSQLAMVSEIEIHTFEDMKKAIIKRMEYFNEMGCLVSDHGLDYVMYAPASEEEIEKIFEKGLKPVKANKFYYFKHPMAKEMARCEISHNDIGEIDRGTWRKYNPYNPYVEEKDEKAVDNLNIESLDDLFDDLDNNEKNNISNSSNSNNNVENKNNTTNKPKEDSASSILDLDFDDDAPILPQEQENDDDTYDLQKELEAKFDELFGPLEDDE